MRKRGQVFAWVFVGILLLVVFGPKLGLFAVTSDDLHKCVLGETKCCGTSNIYCTDGTGNLQFKCVAVNYADGTFAYNHFMGLGEKTPCVSNVLSRTYYRLENNACTSIYLRVAEKTLNDYETSTECNSHRNVNTIGLNNNPLDYECPCNTGKESCAGFVYFSCENSEWVNKGEVSGKCGKDCSGLLGSLASICKTGKDVYGVSNFVNPIKTCDYYNPQNQTQTETETEDTSEGIINVGGFTVELWMILAVAGLLLSLILIK